MQQIAKADPNDVFSEIGEQLGVLMDVLDSLSDALLEEEKSGRSVYKGNESAGRRALRRIIIRERISLIFTEIRETMVFKAPKELGALWGKYSEMMERIAKEQEAAHAEELRQLQTLRWRRRKAIEEIKARAFWGIAVIFVMLWATGIMFLTMKSAKLYHGLY